MNRLDQLPQKVDDLSLQIAQLSARMESEFSAVRAEIAAGDEETRRQMRELHADTLARIDHGDEETRTQMRVLHEEVIARIALLREGPPNARHNRKKR